MVERGEDISEEFFGFFDGAIDDGDTGSTGMGEGERSRPGCTTCTEDDDGQAVGVEAADVGHLVEEGWCVGIGGTQSPIGEADDGVGSADEFSDGVDFVDEGHDGELVWQGNVGTIDVWCTQRFDARGQVCQRGLPALVVCVEPEVGECSVVHRRRLTVRHGVTDDTGDPRLIGRHGGLRTLVLLGARKVFLLEDEELVVRGSEIVLARCTALGDEVHIVGSCIGTSGCPQGGQSGCADGTGRQTILDAGVVQARGAVDFVDGQIVEFGPPITGLAEDVLHRWVRLELATAGFAGVFGLEAVPKHRRDECHFVVAGCLTLDNRGHGDDVVDGHIGDLDFAFEGGVLFFEVADEQIDDVGDGVGFVEAIGVGEQIALERRVGRERIEVDMTGFEARTGLKCRQCHGLGDIEEPSIADYLGDLFEPHPFDNGDLDFFDAGLLQGNHDFVHGHVLAQHKGPGLEFVVEIL